MDFCARKTSTAWRRPKRVELEKRMKEVTMPEQQQLVGLTPHAANVQAVVDE